jgi:hypothetical protein
MVTYNPGTPQGPDIPSDSQDEFLTNFDLLNQFMGVDHIPFGNTVSFATSANPCVCTSAAHGLTTGNTVNITHFGSLVGDIIQPWTINGGPYTVTVIDVNTFSMNVDASAQLPYLLNTGAFSCPQFNYGFHKKTFFPNVLQQGPNTTPPLGSPYSAYYSKSQLEKVNNTDIDVAQLFFQNSPGSGFEKQLTLLNFVEVSNANGRGVITPWGVKINFGQITFQSTTHTYDLPVPFTSEFWAIIGTLQIAKPNNKLQRPFWQMSAVGLTKFSAIERTGDPETTLHKVPGWYFAIGV